MIATQRLSSPEPHEAAPVMAVLKTTSSMPRSTVKLRLSRISQSMLNLFASHRSRHLRSVSSTNERLAIDKPRLAKLKKCASVGAPPTAKTSWGMIPVLNELEKHPSFCQTEGDRAVSGLLRRRSSQSVCLNCRGLFFKELSGVDADFCSLDCQTTHRYVHDLQDVIDVELDGSCSWSDETCSTLASGFSSS
ncbi:hypothetical protein FI667_g14696, partial [Globisporangium splendens]